MTSAQGQVTPDDIATAIEWWFRFDFEADPGHWGGNIAAVARATDSPSVVIQHADGPVFRIAVTEVTGDGT